MVGRGGNLGHVAEHGSSCLMDHHAGAGFYPHTAGDMGDFNGRTEAGSADSRDGGPMAQCIVDSQGGQRIAPDGIIY